VLRMVSDRFSPVGRWQGAPLSAHRVEEFGGSHGWADSGAPVFFVAPPGQCSSSRERGWLGRRVGISSRRFQQAHSTASRARDGIQADGGKLKNTISRFMVDNCIYHATIGNMPFIQFPFIEVPKQLRKLIGEGRAPFPEDRLSDGGGCGAARVVPDDFGTDWTAEICNCDVKMSKSERNHMKTTATTEAVFFMSSPEFRGRHLSAMRRCSI